MAPPTMAIHKVPDAWLVNTPSLLIAILKIVGNMIELQNPTAINDHIATPPWPKTAVKMSTIEQAALNAKTLPGLT